MIELFWAELKRTWLEFIRYPAEAMGGVAIITMVFYGLFLGAQYMTGPASQFGDRLDAIVIGYVLWTLVVFVLVDIALNLQLETQTGTLEQVLLSPFGAPQIFFARAVASLTLRLALILSILIIIMGLTGSRVSFPLLLLLPLGSVIMGAYGLAFVVGSLALLFKRVQQLVGIFQFGLLFLMATPTEEWTGRAGVLAQLLPMTGGAGLLRDLMARGEPLDVGRWVISLGVGLVYLGMGLLCFRWAVEQAKRRGILGSY
ncbi:MAG: ABC transporter permease [Synechococcaceae cyanobacterium SM2_3_1]|nr:ABC transporter permease [Synechococcaceae cyanobacterium SM2_3_1]